MKPAVVFDLGKVLVDFDYSIAARKIAARSARPPENLHGSLGSSPLLVEYESGWLTKKRARP
jgi:phosphoglycolate phosphatase-like HAD superfamily hydrolase